MEYTLSFPELNRYFAARTMMEGSLIHSSGEVNPYRWVQIGGMSRVHADVADANVFIQLELNDGKIHYAFNCSAKELAGPCKHIAALGLHLTRNPDEELTVSDDAGLQAHEGSSPRPIPHWQRSLQALLPKVESEADIVGLGLLVSVAHVQHRHAASYDIKVRPAQPGSRSPWVQSGVSWANLQNDKRFDQTQRKAMMELHGLMLRQSEAYYYNHWGNDWVTLNALPGEELAHSLKKIRDSGVAIVSAKTKQPVNFPQSTARGFIDFKEDPTGLTLEPKLVTPEGFPKSMVALGRPPAAAVYSDGAPDKAGPLHLACFEPAITNELIDLIRNGPLEIPADQIDEFNQSFMSRVRLVAPLSSTDGSFEFPEPARPMLMLELRHSHKELTGVFSWKYADSGVRQRNTERLIIRSVLDKVGSEGPLVQSSTGNFAPLNLGISESIDFVIGVLPLLREHPDVHVDEQTSVPDYRVVEGSAVVKIGAGESSNDWFDLNVDIKLADRDIPFVELFSALSAGEEYLVLDDARVVPIDGEEFHALRQLIAEAGELAQSTSSGVRMHRLSIDWWQELVALGIIEAQENEWLASMAKLTGAEGLERVQVPEAFTATLRDYQQHGLNWLDFLRRHQLGGVLADDMGLGKTVQLLAALETARLEDPEARYLVVAPTSVVGNWASEAAKFTPQLRTTTLGETSTKRRTSVAEATGDAQLVITSYAIFRMDFENFEAMGFSVLILDEAQMVKNHASKGYKQVRQIQIPCKFVVTGTPVENNLLELWALTSLAAPGLLGGLKSFKDNYSKPISSGDSSRMQRLKSRLRPFVLRRTKEQVAKDLPAKTEQVIHVELEPAHRKAYDRRFQRVRQEVLGLVQDVDSNRFKILQSLTLLRQLALDPSLVDEGNGPSAKLELLHSLLEDAVAEGHKILVFSQFTSFLSKARGVALGLGFDTGYLDGSTSGARRRQLIEDFGLGKFPVFFISLKSGGFGINLTAADYCILLDPWWNPAAEAQAIDRAHRIGQDKPVYVYRLVAKDTIEDKVLALQARKTQLFNDVLGDADQMASATSLGTEDFLALLE
ncbi:DEAD/DEAH box helicase [Glutamicibacter arilaitensis]|uniref:DEAD/DEAH box helicase n=1 Tax=Glutamicibacter arilaitensis TaxID=256701 RepID=UPI00384CCEE7